MSLFLIAVPLGNERSTIESRLAAKLLNDVQPSVAFARRKERGRIEKKEAESKKGGGERERICAAR